MSTSIILNGGMFNKLRERLSKIKYKELFKKIIPKRYRLTPDELKQQKELKLQTQKQELRDHFKKEKEKSNLYYKDKISKRTIKEIKKDGYYLGKIKPTNTPQSIKYNKDKLKYLIQLREKSYKNVNKEYVNTIHMINSIPVPFINLNPSSINNTIKNVPLKSILKKNNSNTLGRQAKIKKKISFPLKLNNV
jgi:hypothetical protein